MKMLFFFKINKNIQKSSSLLSSSSSLRYSLSSLSSSSENNNNSHFSANIPSNFSSNNSSSIPSNNSSNISSNISSNNSNIPSNNSSNSSDNHPLIDSFQRYHNYLRISLTEKCNLRCIYCMPIEGVKLTQSNLLLTLNERIKLINLFTSYGVNKIRFTGGEPTINKQLIDLIKHCNSIKTIKSIGITTNGLILKSQLDKLCEAGLTHVNISLDTLDPIKFEKISRRDKKGLAMILSSIYAALSKNISVKLNCVLMRNINYSEIIDFVKLTQEARVDVRFIEVMPFEDNHWDPQQLVPYYEAIDYLKEQGYELELTKDKKDPHDTTKWYRLKTNNDNNNNNNNDNNGERETGRVGFITSMSSHFCSGCNRLRITADGKLKVCLFGNEEVDLLNPLRDGQSNEEITKLIADGVRRKKKSLGGHDTPATIAASENRPMILIGG